MLESGLQQAVSIALALQCMLQYKLMNIFSIKCYIRANLKINVTKNRTLWGISLVKSKSEINSPGIFLLINIFKKYITFYEKKYINIQNKYVDIQKVYQVHQYLKEVYWYL